MAEWTEETNWVDSYAGAISFMRMAYATSAAGADIAVMGVPYDMGTSGRPGARFGPRAIREQSLQAGEFEWGVYPWGYEVRDEYRCVDVGDVTGFTAYTDRIAPAVQKKADEVLATGASLVSLGGDHFISLPLLRAYAKRHGEPLALIHFDAHSDTWRSDDVNHGTMFFHAIQEGLIDPDVSMQIGLRTPDPETFDIDCLDPSNAPGTGTPVAGGVTVGWARRVLHGLDGLRIVGGDQVEVAPHYDGPAQITALVGATIAADILYLVAGGRRARGM